MRTFASLILLGMIAILVVACSGNALQAEESPVNPGDQVGDFLVTTGKGEDFIYRMDLFCNTQGDDQNFSCKTRVDSKVNISVGIYGLDRSKLDEYWSSLSYELYIGNRPVNTQAFGTIDVEKPGAGMMRVWDVMLVTNKPGVIMVHDSGTVNGEDFQYTGIIKFTAP